MIEEILGQAYGEKNWEPLKACLTQQKTTIKELTTVSIHVISTPSSLPDNFDAAWLPTFDLNIVTIAAMQGRTDILNLLFEYGLEITPENNAALIDAASGGYTATVKLLLAKGADVNFRGKEGKTALGEVILGGISSNDSDNKSDEDFDDNPDNDDERLVEMVELLLQSGANQYSRVTENEWQHESSVVSAVGHRSSQVISLLVDPRFRNNQHDLSPDQILIEHTMALGNAIQRRLDDYEEIVDIFIKAGVNFRSGEGGHTLSVAAATGNAALVEKLLNLGANPNHYDEYPYPTRSRPKNYFDTFTPLMNAIVGIRMGVPNNFSLVSGILAPRNDQADDLAVAHDLPAPPKLDERSRKHHEERARKYNRPGPHWEVIKLLLAHGAVPSSPKGSSPENALKLAEIMENEALLDLFRSCKNEMAPRTDIGFFYAYDIFDRNGVSTAEISQRTINSLLPRECILHRGDLIINGNVPKGAQIRVIDGDIRIHGSVEEDTVIFSSPMPLIRLRNGTSFMLGNYAILEPNGRVQLEVPYTLTGAGNLNERRMILNGTEYIVPCTEAVPSIKGGHIFIDGHITDSTNVIALGEVFVNGKPMLRISPYDLDCDTGEVTEHTLRFFKDSAYMFFRHEEANDGKTSYENMFLFKKAMTSEEPISPMVFFDPAREKERLAETLYYAVKYGKLGYLKLLIAKQVDVNAIPWRVFPWHTSGLISPLKIATENGHQEAVRLLLEAGAVPLTTEAAASTAQSSTIPPLIFTKPNTDTQGLHARRITDIDALMTVLKKCRTSKDGDNIPSPELALRRAARMGWLQEVKNLVSLVKDLTLDTEGADSGKTALDFAKEHDHTAVIDFLKSVGAKPGKVKLN